MPAVTFNLYDQFRKNSFNGGDVDFDAATLKMATVTSGYTPNQNTDDFFDDVSASEVTGTGYTAGGQATANGISTVDGAGLVTVDADDPATITQNAGGFSNGRRNVWYDDTGVESTSRLVGFSNDFGSDQGNVDGDFSTTFNAAGAFTSAR